MWTHDLILTEGKSSLAGGKVGVMEKTGQANQKEREKINKVSYFVRCDISRRKN